MYLKGGAWQELGYVLVAVVRRLWHASLAALMQSLICVLARAVLATSNLSTLMSLLQSISLPNRETNEPSVDGLQGALMCWVAHHPKLIGAPMIRFSMRALEVLLQQPALQAIKLLPWTSPHLPPAKIRVVVQPRLAVCVLVEVLARSMHKELAKARGEHGHIDHSSNMCDFDFEWSGLCSMSMRDDDEEDEAKFVDVHPPSASVVQTLKAFACNNPTLINEDIQKLLHGLLE